MAVLLQDAHMPVLHALELGATFPPGESPSSAQEPEIIRAIALTQSLSALAAERGKPFVSPFFQNPFTSFFPNACVEFRVAGLLPRLPNQ